jgi:hypothetical protein
VTFTVPHTWVAGDDATSGNLQSLTQALLELQAPALFRLQQTVAQSVPNTTATGITFDAEDFDLDGGHNPVTNNSRYTAQTAGYYLFGGAVAIAGNVTGQRLARFAINGGPIAGTQFGFVTVPNAGAMIMTATPTPILMAVGDFVELQLSQTSGGALSTLVSGSSQSMMTGVLLRRT